MFRLQIIILLFTSNMLFAQNEAPKPKKNIGS